MTDTITERSLAQARVGDQVECMIGGVWTPGTVAEAPCGCHVDVRFADRENTIRFATDNTERIRWQQPPSSEVDEIPTWDGENTRPQRLAAFDAAGIEFGDRVRVTMFSRQHSGGALQRAEYNPEGEWTLDSVDRNDSNRTFHIRGHLLGEQVARWVANIERWAEPVSHGETPPDWPQVGEHVRIALDDGFTFGVVEAIPANREEQRFQVATATHGRLYPLRSVMSLPDPLEWAQAVRSEDPEAQRLATAIADTQARIDAAAVERRRFLDRVQEVASRTANDEDWCGVADAGLAKLGLTRLHALPDTEDVGWSVDVTLDVDRELDTDEAAEMLADHFEIDTDEVDVSRGVTISGTVTVTVNGVLDEMPEGECICGHIGRNQIREALPDWARGLSFDHYEVTCDNDN